MSDRLDMSMLRATLHAEGRQREPMWVLGASIMKGTVNFPECVPMLSDITDDAEDFSALFKASGYWTNVAYAIWRKYHTEQYPDHPDEHSGCYPMGNLEGGALDKGAALGFAFCDRYYRGEKEEAFSDFQEEFHKLEAEEMADCIMMVLNQNASLIHQIFKLKGYDPSDPMSLLSAIDQLKFD